MFRKLLEKIAYSIEQHYFKVDMRFYEKTGWKFKEIVDRFLKAKNYNFVSAMNPEPELGWPKVSIEVLIETDTYTELLNIWTETCIQAYPQLTKKERHGVFLHFDQLISEKPLEVKPKP